MSPHLLQLFFITIRFPRVSGDEPQASHTHDVMQAFSPRERG